MMYASKTSSRRMMIPGDVNWNPSEDGDIPSFSVLITEVTL